ncbi:MAG: glycosyltransferase family 2 protein [Pseudomonadota bacterium]
MPNTQPTLSVIITSYNYESFIATAIDSLLAQDPRPEIIVVDDCSTDSSRDIISAYGDQVIPVFQEHNQGHGGAFNAGFEKASGTLVMFLDADDFMLPGVTERILSNYSADTAIYHYRMKYADDEGKLWGCHPPMESPLADGDLSQQLRTVGDYRGTITSGLVFSRGALEQVLPMNAEKYRQGGDGYLTATVPLYGPSASFDEPMSAYRLHGAQHSQFAKAYAKRARWRLAHAYERYDSIKDHAARLGLSVAPDLGAADAGTIKERLISLLFEAEQHPYPEDSIPALAKQTKAAYADTTSGPGALIQSIWWMLFGLVPAGAKQTMMSWDIDAAARPGWLQSIGRTLRGRSND